jgi:hypothetical protein
VSVFARALWLGRVAQREGMCGAREANFLIILSKIIR